MGWTNPWVVAGLAGGVGLLAVFAVLETRVAEPMFQLSLFRIRALRCRGRWPAAHCGVAGRGRRRGLAAARPPHAAAVSRRLSG